MISLEERIMGQTFFLWGPHHIPAREGLAPSTQTTGVQIHLLPRRLTWSVGHVWLCISVVFLPFCSSGLGVACFCVFLRAREYEWNEANNFTDVYNSKHSSCIRLLRKCLSSACSAPGNIKVLRLQRCVTHEPCHWGAFSGPCSR